MDATNAAPLADHVLQDLMQRTGVIEHSVKGGSAAPLTGWRFVHGLASLEPDLRKACAPQLEFIERFKDNWRPKPPRKFDFPEDWKPTDADHDMFKNTTNSLASREMEVLVRNAGDAFTMLSHAETVARHDAPASFEPDFFLSVPVHYVRKVGYSYIQSVEETFRPDTEHSLEHFKPVVFYAGDERDATAIIPGAFLCTPGCWMRSHPTYRFPLTIMGPNQGQISDFSLLLHSIGPSREFALRRDSRLRVTLINPALVVGVKGPVLWKNSLAYPSCVKRPKNFEEAVKDLATAVQPSLDTHLLNWQLRCEQMPEKSSDQLMPWFMMFGIIYDAERIVIVAHIPYIYPQQNEGSGQPTTTTKPQYSYLSCVVDSIPFPSASPGNERSESWWVERFRVAYALFSLQKHAFQLASLWESVVWPAEITLTEAAVEREHLGPTPTTSEHGDDPPSYTIDLEELSMSSSEQQEELDLEIEHRDNRAREILPDLLEWVEKVR